MARFKMASLITSLLLTGVVTTAHAGMITSATSVSTNMATSFGSTISNIIDRSGLQTPYTSGEDFDAYITTKPKHNYEYQTNTDPTAYYDYEWFSAEGTTSGNIIFDLGNILYIDKLAIWNEDSHGINGFNVSTSISGTDGSWTNVGGNLFATDNDINSPYTADVFDFGLASLARYVKMDINSVHSNPILRGGDGLDFVSLGEVAFSTTPVPEPATLLLFGTGLSALAALRRRKK